MLIDLAQIVRERRLPVGRVIHVGGNIGEEGELYSSWGSQVIWFEPRADAAMQIRRKYPTHIVVEAAAGATVGFSPIWLASNGQSSSLLRPRAHLELHPEISFERSCEVPVIPVDLVAQESDALVVDAQGYEEYVLEGARKCLGRCQWVYLEVNRAELFKGCPTIERLDELLVRHRRVETRWVLGRNWGDALWVLK